MMRFRDIIGAAALALSLAAAPAAKAEDVEALRRAVAAAEARDWDAASEAAAQSGEIASALVEWHRLRAGTGTWAEYLAFTRQYGDWPGLDLIWQRGEARIGAAPSPEVLEWFDGRTPLTGAGAMAYVKALEAAGRDTDAEAELRRIWTRMELSEAEETRLLEEYSPALPALHAERVFGLLDQFSHEAAGRMLDRIAPEKADLARARIALQSGADGVDRLILALPDEAQDDAGLAMDRFRWRVAARRLDLARELLAERSGSAEALRRPEIWGPQRVDYARALIRDGAWDEAERIAAAHHLPDPSGAVFADLEFLAGYAALRGGAPDRALTHFDTLLDGTSTPISLSRAHYWRGRALEAAGDEAGATAAFTDAAQYQGAFYGQVAAERLGLPMDEALSIPGRAEAALPQWRRSDLRENSVFQAGTFAFAAGYPALGQRFFLHLSETAEPDDIARMARLTLEMHHPYYALRLAKRAAGRGAIYPAAYFPLTGLEESDLGVAPELIMAIARQESEFNPTVASHAGAQGLMQVMPGTAQDMAARIGVDYNLARLTQDAHYNARLGAAYLQGLERSFGPSSALIAAGYNAGPGRSRQWTERFGDIRTAVDPVDWVEMIPFDETRNYVMRVTEALPVYRARIAGAPVPLTPRRDLAGGGVIPDPPRARQTLADEALITQSLRPPREGDALSDAAAAFEAEEDQAIAALLAAAQEPLNGPVQVEAAAEEAAGPAVDAIPPGSTPPVPRPGG
ncbi:MAG: lytic transglycosylase domain-containing protein [Paracoccus sp. (in: a-proteobacteria)]|nr:lytic transglycosylase domain-containing protein [Paracoccus sp. (in: a-proteobacteria)]